MPQSPMLKDFAERCRKLATSETDPRLRTTFLQMAADYERRAQIPGR
ncbi:MAG: hypothetical protein ABIQ32_02035 [Sphingomicrobium sp.]